MSGPSVAAGALFPARPRTRLVDDPDERPQLTSYRETDARTALSRGLSEYLQGRTLDLPGGRQVSLVNVYDQWPEAEQDVLYPALTCVPNGEGEYGDKSLTPVLGGRIRTPDGRWLLEWAELVQEIRAELHTNDPEERVGLTALIEDACCPVDWMTGFKLELPHYFGQFAHYLPRKIHYPDTAETALERLRVTYVHFKAEVAVVKLVEMPTMRARLEIVVPSGNEGRLGSIPSGSVVVGDVSLDNLPGPPASPTSSVFVYDELLLLLAPGG